MLVLLQRKAVLIAWIGLLALAAAACAPAQTQGSPAPSQESTQLATAPQPSPTLVPSPTFTPAASATVIAPTTASATPPATASATATTRPSPTPTLASVLATITQPSTASLPKARIQFLSPGMGSKVISPIDLKAYVYPETDGVVTVELLGEDGRLLRREVKVYGYEEGLGAVVHLSVDFEIPGVAEAARLQIRLQDENGLPVAIGSLDLILLSVGEADLNEAGDLLEEIYIQQPQPEALLQGGSLHLAGLARLRGEGPLLIEIWSESGQLIGSRQVAVQPHAAGEHGYFSMDVPYTVYEPTRARLIVWERGNPVPGAAQLSSLEVLLSP